VNYDKIATKLMKASSALGNSDNDHDALAVYLVGCSVSLLRERTPARFQEIVGLLKMVVAKQSKKREQS